MKTTKTLSLIAASKLAVGIGSAAHADDASLGSKMPAETAPKLGLFEIGYPLELLTPPTEGLANAASSTGSKNTTADANAQQIAKKGRIWTKVIPKQDPTTGAFPQNTPHPRVDFVVSNIRNDGPVTVYLLYGTRLAASPMTLRPNAGTFNLDLNSLGQDTHLLAGVKLQPEEKIAGLPPSPVGKDLGPKTRSAVISISLNDLTKVMGNEIYFQAAVVPDNGGIPEAQASEVDYFVIERVRTDKPNSGSKASKTATSTITNNGTTTQQTCGKQGVVAVCNNSTNGTTPTAPTQTTGSKNTTTTTGSDTGSKSTTASSTTTTGGTTETGSKQ